MTEEELNEVVAKASEMNQKDGLNNVRILGGIESQDARDENDITTESVNESIYNDIYFS